MNSKKKRRGQMSEAFCTAMFLSVRVLYSLLLLVILDKCLCSEISVAVCFKLFINGKNLA